MSLGLHLKANEIMSFKYRVGGRIELKSLCFYFCIYLVVDYKANIYVNILFFSKRPTPEECHENRWLLPTDYMIKKRERSVFLGHRIKDYSEEYHSEKEHSAQKSSSSFGLKLAKSDSIELNDL